ncbi:hypothetical protein [Sphingomonas alba]|uniref:OmpA-like domain-containing protein n=1 Tax=Sphingomonas alba TaxID=2908208 RepID=A0ABT0RP42_9SPHN|nr:hypothetical protein [Sphingomonas alba]MCL6684422.1 hypothetical protein [Sphingomonas alba]
MARSRRLDANARTWLTLAITLFLTGPIVALRSCVQTTLDKDRVVISSQIDERLVSLKNGTTLVLEPGSIGYKMANWLKVGTTTTHQFSVGDEVFASGSAEPTPDGAHRVADFAQMMKAHPELTTQIMITTAKGIKTEAEDQLEQSRAQRLQRDIVALGVERTKIAVVAQPVEVKTGKPSEHPHLLIVLERAHA